MDATAALADYLAAAGASATIVGDYTLDSELVVPNSVTSLEIPAGSRLVGRGNHSVLRRSGTVTFRELLAANVAQGDTVITARAGGGYSVGEYILLTTYDVIPDSPDKYGYLRLVTGVSGASITIDQGSPRAMVLQPRTASIVLAPSLRLFGAGEITTADATVVTTPLVYLFAVNNPVVEGLDIHDSGGTGVAAAHCLGGKIDCSIHDLMDDGSTYFGYGVNVLGATRGLLVQGTMTRVRHAVTTNPGPSLTGIGPAGEPEDCLFQPAARDCSDKSIDTHRAGWNTTIVPDVVGGRGGVQIRADNTKVQGGSITASAGPGIAVASVVGVAPTISGTSITYLKPSGTALLCNAASTVSDVTIRDCYGNNIVLSDNCTVTGGSISAGGTVGVQFLGSNNTVDGLQLGTSVLTPYVEAAGVTGNSFNTSPPTDIEPLPAPVATTLPTITGELAVGMQVKATFGKWNVSPVTYTYTWLRNGVVLGNATARTHPKYDITSQDMGKTLSVRVTADRAGYAQGVATSVPTEPIGGGAALVATTAPTMSGTGEIGSYLSVTNGTWNPAAQSWDYAWFVDGVEASGLTTNRVQIASGWAGKSITARVTAGRSGWGSGVATTAAMKMAAASIVNTTRPVVAGTPTVGAYITVDKGSWSPYPGAWSYSWFVNGVVVSGLTAARVQVKSDWAGKQVTARVTASKSGWTSASADSVAISVPQAPLKNTTRPVISGTPKVGAFVTVSKGSWTPAASSYLIAWYVDGVVVANLNTTRVQVKSAWAGKSLVAKVTAVKSGWSNTSSSSAAVTVTA